MRAGCPRTPDIAVAPLLARFRAHAPERLTPYRGVIDALEALRAHVAIGLVTDGNPTIQRNKLRALGLEARFDIVVLTDELGRAPEAEPSSSSCSPHQARSRTRQAAVYVG